MTCNFEVGEEGSRYLDIYKEGGIFIGLKIKISTNCLELVRLLWKWKKFAKTFFQFWSQLWNEKIDAGSSAIVDSGFFCEVIEIMIKQN